MGGLLHDIVRDTLAAQPDMKVIGDAHDGGDLNPMLQAGNVDVVVVGAPRPEDFAVAIPILLTSPRIKVLAIAISGRRAMLYRLRPHQIPLGDMSPQDLVGAIRAEAGSGRDWRPAG
jgi:hypothetical protein